MRIALLALCALTTALPQTTERPARAVTDPGTVTTRQAITPAGVPAIFNGRVYGVTFGASPSEVWVLNATHVYRMDWRTNKILESTPLGGTPGLQSIRWDTVSKRALVGAAVRVRGSENAASYRAATIRKRVFATGFTELSLREQPRYGRRTRGRR